MSSPSASGAAAAGSLKLSNETNFSLLQDSAAMWYPSRPGHCLQGVGRGWGGRGEGEGRERGGEGEEREGGPCDKASWEFSTCLQYWDCINFFPNVNIKIRKLITSSV